MLPCDSPPSFMVYMQFWLEHSGVFSIGCIYTRVFLWNIEFFRERSPCTNAAFICIAAEGTGVAGFQPPRHLSAVLPSLLPRRPTACSCRWMQRWVSMPSCLPIWRSHAGIKQRIRPQAHQKKKTLPYSRLNYSSSLSAHCPISSSLVFLQYVILSLRLPVSIPSLPRSPVFLPVFGVIMLLSRSLLSECSLAELIFGWCYITAPPSHLGADLLRSQDKQAVKWKPEKSLWIHFTEFAALFPYISR